jgi:hypothetical protein
MMAFSWFLLMSMAALAPPTAQTEMLGIDVPDDFEVGYRARNQVLDMTEIVQPPETVETWTKLITLQLFYDGTRRQTAGSFYGQWRNSMRQVCVGMTETAIKGTVDGQPAIRGVLACPKNPQTGKPENLTTVLVQGGVNLMMVQVAFRHPIAAEDNALIDRVIGSLKVCDQRTLKACSARHATGFVTNAR